MEQQFLYPPNYSASWIRTPAILFDKSKRKMEIFYYVTLAPPIVKNVWQNDLM